MQIKEMDSLLKAISDETRLKIISYLVRDSFCACELMEFLGMSQPAVSQHMKKLRDAGITSEEKRGRWVYYSLNKQCEMYPVILHIVNLMPSVDISSDRCICN
ncbi:ArsR/SmtB family transcription factor [Lederbergia graminis]|uniref:ArsR/SmtB family transcription factor n=1 Tax=Lederbergia graminis TaxID=735518 RepID=A0ABW0LHI7_9BACI